MNKLGFNNNEYLKTQSQHILERIKMFDNKLYLEFGGKLFDDHHAARVLPGFEPDSKLKMLLKLKEQVEILIVINAADIEKNKVRSDLGITYDDEVLRLIDAFRGIDLLVGSVIIAQYQHQPSADTFIKHLHQLGIKTAKHYPIVGYPNNINLIVSEEGFGKNDYVETTRPLVVVTAPGPGSGKMATCLSQLYHEHQRGIKAGYAKFETFPIWNLPLKHPVNLAYEAATADLNDINMIDPFHLEAYEITTVNYNRDVEVFPVLNAILDKIADKSPYKSPTDMGVNMVGYCITDNSVCVQASHNEIIRRYYQSLVEFKKGLVDIDTISKIEMVMSQADITTDIRACVHPCLERAELTQAPACAIQLPNGKIITGRTSPLLGAASACILNSLKELGNIDHDIFLISPSVIEPIQKLKVENLGNSNPKLHVDEILIALSIAATTNPLSHTALNQLKKLKGCEAHSSVILSDVDMNVFRKLGVRLTCEPKYHTKKLYHK